MKIEGNVTVFEKPEKTRIYHFENGAELVLHEVVELLVRPSGTHRVKTKDGKSYIVKDSWLWITLEIEDWSV